MSHHPLLAVSCRSPILLPALGSLLFIQREAAIHSGKNSLQRQNLGPYPLPYEPRNTIKHFPSLLCADRGWQFVTSKPNPIPVLKAYKSSLAFLGWLYSYFEGEPSELHPGRPFHPNHLLAQPPLCLVPSSGPADRSGERSEMFAHGTVKKPMIGHSMIGEKVFN